MTQTAKILGLYLGKPEHRWQGKDPTAIRKVLTSGPLQVTKTGITGDQQADLAVHGGPEKALHIYPSEHYDSWRTDFPEKADIFRVGGFGENISSQGFTEQDLCVGDVFTAGSARIQISQGRQPCWKLNLHTGNPAQAAAFQKSGKTGWYFRVLEEGRMEAGDVLTLTDRPCPDWNLRQVILARFDPRLDPDIAAALSRLDQLAEPWRTSFAKKANRDYVEDTSRRLKG
ncbi:MAG: MOSC domain-containing protein [Roseibium sp.]|uniref:MOSC domain-containing protein n=1 Tax=Roseibium sp. TaxID=1936156 RepID=UPI0026396918|nr:MOSC domain-containing protein [Roseibium sp.]MCV0427810.1 MOSC domain-containing protein [Roseibium sp.]